MSARAMLAAARLLVALAVLLLLGGGVNWLLHRPWFDFRRIELRGDVVHVNAASVRAAIAGQLHGNFFTARLPEVQRTFESVPWVAAASVRRVWPDRLVVSVREHRALGLWSDGRLLADNGELFVANLAEAELYGPLVQFDGPESMAHEAARRYYEIAARLAPLALGVASVEISERASWSVVTEAGQRFELGRDEPAGRLSERLVLLAAAYPRVSAQLGGPPKRIDLRYPNGLAAVGAAGKATGKKS